MEQIKGVYDHFRFVEEWQKSFFFVFWHRTVAFWARDAVKRLCYETGEKWVKMNKHILLIWLDQGLRGSRFLTQGIIGSPPELSPVRAV